MITSSRPEQHANAWLLIDTIPSKISIDLIDEHEWKALSPIAVILDKSICLSDEQLKNAFDSIALTDFGIRTSSSFVHPLNVEYLIVVTRLDISIRISDMQLLNAFSPIILTEFGIVMLLSDSHPSKA